MAELLNKVNRNYYLYGRSVLEITGDANTFITLKITGLGKILFWGKLFSDERGFVNIDLRDVFAESNIIHFPSPYIFVSMDNCLEFNVSINNIPEQEPFYFHFYSETSKLFLSEIKELYIPKNYLLPLCLHQQLLQDLEIHIFDSETNIPISVSDREKQEALNRPGTKTRLYDISKIPLLGNSFEIAVNYSGQKSPHSTIFHVVPFAFEQYIFKNEFGGWDNVPMNGKRIFHPEYTFSSGVYGNKLIPTNRNVKETFTQYTGPMDRYTIFVLSRLLSSSDIYHLKNGEWKRIVIKNCECSVNSEENIHNLSFTYQYVEKIQIFISNEQ